MQNHTENQERAINLSILAVSESGDFSVLRQMKLLVGWLCVVVVVVVVVVLWLWLWLWCVCGVVCRSDTLENPRVYIPNVSRVYVATRPHV